MFDNAHRLIDHIVNQLFAAEKRRLANDIDRMCRANSSAHNETLHGFHYREGFHTLQGVKGNLKRKSLHLSLHDEMENVLADRKTVREHEQTIRQALAKLLYSCFLTQHVRDTLPDCLAQLLPEDIRNLERCGSPANTIVGDVRAQRLYDKALPLMEMYAAGRLLY